MLYVFLTPMIPVLDLAGAPVIGAGGEPKRRPKSDAGSCMAVIEQMIGMCECDVQTQYRKDGVYQLQTERRLRPEIDPKMVILDQANPTLGLLTDEDYIDEKIGESRLPSGGDVRFSPALEGLSLADFPEGATFGNGVSCGASFGDGSITISFVVLSGPAALAVEADPAKYEALRQIMES